MFIDRYRIDHCKATSGMCICFIYLFLMWVFIIQFIYLYHSLSRSALPRCASHMRVVKRRIPGKEMWVPQHVPFFEHNEYFEAQPHPRFYVAWTANVAQNWIQFTLAVNTEGWIGWGPTASGSMIGGNPAVIREATPGNINTITCYATHSESFSTPVNEDQNCELISFERRVNETLVTFRRPFVGCAPDDQHFKQWETQHMIAAWGESQTGAAQGLQPLWL